jgi:hypothetical protein
MLLRRNASAIGHEARNGGDHSIVDLDEYRYRRPAATNEFTIASG